MTNERTGESILRLAEAHLGEKYVFGTRVPKADPKWKGPWDCAEFVTWCVYQATGILFGTRPRDNAMMAEAYTGYWTEQAIAENARVDVESAVAIPGAILLRSPTEKNGHIAFSDGAGGTLEAHSTKRGVTGAKASGRRWDMGVLVPSVTYFLSDEPVPFEQPEGVLRVTQPLTRGPLVRKLQRALAEAGFLPGKADGVYGPQTAFAVREFQAKKGLVADGEAGAATLEALKLKAQLRRSG